MKLFVSILAVFSVSSAADQMFRPGPDNKMEAKGIVTVEIPWINDEGDSYDVQFRVTNDNDDKGMIIFMSDLSCKRGNVTGRLKYTFFNAGERTIDFKPGETKEFKMVCKTEDHKKGDFKLNIARIYNNPSLDGKTVGKIIAKGLSFTQSDRNE
jgi:hypothetical protein